MPLCLFFGHRPRAVEFSYSWCADRDKNAYVRFFTAVLKPENTLRIAWYDDRSAEVPRFNSPAQVQDARILGLLLCAGLVRDGFTVEDFSQ